MLWQSKCQVPNEIYISHQVFIFRQQIKQFMYLAVSYYFCSGNILDGVSMCYNCHNGVQPTMCVSYASSHVVFALAIYCRPSVYHYLIKLTLMQEFSFPRY